MSDDNPYLRELADELAEVAMDVEWDLVLFGNVRPELLRRLRLAIDNYYEGTEE